MSERLVLGDGVPGPHRLPRTSRPDLTYLLGLLRWVREPAVALTPLSNNKLNGLVELHLSLYPPP